MKKRFEQDLGISPNIPEIGKEPLPGTDLGGAKKEVYTIIPGKDGKNDLFPKQKKVMADIEAGTQEIRNRQKEKERREFEKENEFAIDNLQLNANSLAAEEEAEAAIAETLDPRTQLQRKINTKTIRYEELQKSAEDLAAKMKDGQSDNLEEDENLLYTLQNEMLKVSGEISELKSEQKNNLFNPIHTQEKKTKEQL